MADLQDKIVTCKKPHLCEWCDTRIEQGEQAHYRVHTHDCDSGLMSSWAHMDCWDAMCKSFSFMHSAGIREWTPGDFQRGEIYDEGC